MKVEDLKEVDFAHWKHHPVTELVMQYLEDFRRETIKEIIASWELGNLSLMTEQEARGRNLALQELTELGLSQIKAFYGVEDAAEVDTDGTS